MTKDFPFKPALVGSPAIDVVPEQGAAPFHFPIFAGNEKLEEELSTYLADILGCTWRQHNEVSGAVSADLEGYGEVVVMVVNPHRGTELDDVTASTIAEYVVLLHNTSLKCRSAK